MLLEAAILLVALLSGAEQAAHGAATEKDEAHTECLLAHFANGNGGTTMTVLCGAEYLPARACYVFTGSRKLAIPPSVQRGQPIRYKFAAAQPWLKFQGSEQWLSFDAISNHAHLFADSREWPARPDALALTVCAGLPARSSP